MNTTILTQGARPDLSRVCWINTDYTSNDTVARRFKSKADADAWIAAQTGAKAPSANNHWTIISCGGFLDEACVLYPYVDFEGVTGSVVKSIVSAVPFTGANTFDITVKNITIGNFYVDEATILRINDCVIENITPVDGAGNGYVQMDNCTILGGDFSNTTGLLPWKNNMFLAFESDIENLTSVGASTEFQGCVFISYPTYWTHSIIELPDNIYNGRAIMEQAFSMSVDPHWRNSVISCLDSVTFEDGAKITSCYVKIDTIDVTGGNFVTYNSEITGAKILSSDATIELHQSISNGGNIDLNDTSALKIYNGSEIDGNVIQVDPTTAINDYRNTITDSSEAASINNVGKLRYREDANNSYLEQVMKTGASTYAWVVVKQNTW